MKVGLDGFALHPLKLDAFGLFEYCHRHGFDGVLLPGIRSLSAELETMHLAEIRARADELALYSNVSVASPNAVAAGRPEAEVATELSAQVQAAAHCGWHELHASLGAERDRYEAPVPWTEQMAASRRVLQTVAPVLRDHGSRINLENHGDTTTFELVRLAQEVGPQVVGICLDTANVLVFAENPVDAVRRAAPYVHMTHAKDAIVFFCDTGLQRQGRAVGQGCLDWESILPILGEHEPGLELSIEDHKWFFFAHIFRDDWMAQQQDLTRDELARTLRLAWQVERCRRDGSLPDPLEYEKTDYAEQMQERLLSGREYLRNLLQRLRLA